MKQIIPSEYEEQKEFVVYLNLKNIKHSAIAHSTFTKSFGQKMKNKLSGLTKGVPDLMICLKNKLLFIEMKRIKKSVISEYQKEWVKELNKIQGNIIRLDTLKE